MVNTCSVVGCYNRSKRDKKSFYSIPSIIKHQGERTEELSTRRRELWLNRLNRPNFIPTRSTKICSDHFISGKPSTLYNHTSPDWAPSVGLRTFKTSKRGSKYRSRAKALQNASSTSSHADYNGAAPQPCEPHLQTTVVKHIIIPENGLTVTKKVLFPGVSNFNQTPTSVASCGLMRLQVPQHNQNSYNKGNVLKSTWEGSPVSKSENLNSKCHSPETNSPSSIEHSHFKKPFVDKALSSCDLSDRCSSKELGDSNSPEIEIVIPIENEPGQSDVRRTIEQGISIVLENTEQISGNKETDNIVGESENQSKGEDKGVYPVYLESVAGEGWCL